MTEKTDRFGLPLLAQGQAQKEVTHNEALAIADSLLCPIVEEVAPAAVPTSPAPGQCWIVGTSPTGAWAGQGGRLAIWTVGGWRFVIPREGMIVWSLADSLPVRRTAIGWETGVLNAQQVRIGGNQIISARLAAVADPSGGPNVDAESRAAIALILTRMRDHGLIAA